MVLFFVRFFFAFVISLAIILGLLWFYHPALSRMGTPQEENAALQSIYSAQDKGAESHKAQSAMTNVAPQCLFFDANKHILPVEPMTTTLTAFYAKTAQVKATSKITGISFNGADAMVTSVNHFTCKFRGKTTTVNTTTKDAWEKLENRWTCDTSKIVKSSNPALGFPVPH